MDYKELNEQFWGQHLWARGYFVASSGNVTDEIIREYIKIYRRGAIQITLKLEKSNTKGRR